MNIKESEYVAKRRYDDRISMAYADRAPEKHVPEMRMLDEAFEVVPAGGRVLDAPCGAGRVSLHLAEQGYEMSAGDISESMLEITRGRFAEAGLEIPVQQEDVEALSYGDDSFDAAVCFRFFHHLPTPELRQKVIGELCRVAKKHVVISYNNPANIRGVEHWFRKIRPWGRKIRINNTSLSEVEGYFKNCGFRLVRDVPFKRLVHNLHTAVFEAKSRDLPEKLDA